MSVIENISVTEDITIISLHGSPADISVISKIFSIILMPSDNYFTPLEIWQKIELFEKFE